eukprot:CFRG5236T1
MNANNPQPFETFLLLGGETKITVENDAKHKNTAVFTINKEDHTLGNLLRGQLLKDPRVLFSGYHIIHPLEFKFELRVQTEPNGTYTPEDALDNAIKDLISECTHLEDVFTREIESKKQSSDPGTAYM